MVRKTNTYGTLTAIQALLLGIWNNPLSQPEIQEITGLTNSTVSRYLRRFKGKLVYIAEWKRAGKRGNYTALWASGFYQLDAPKPKPLSMSQYNKRWRMKKVQSGKVTTTEKGIIHVSE